MWHERRHLIGPFSIFNSSYDRIVVNPLQTEQRWQSLDRVTGFALHTVVCHCLIVFKIRVAFTNQYRGPNDAYTHMIQIVLFTRCMSPGNDICKPLEIFESARTNHNISTTTVHKYVVLIQYYVKPAPRRVILMVSMTASYAVNRGFASRQGYTIDYYKDGTN